MIPVATPDLRGREAEYLAECVADNWVSSAGPFVTAFEQRVAEASGRRFAIACVNGTAAIQLSLLAAGVKPGDRVIVPDWTFAASANAVVHAGGIPAFVDIREQDWILDVTAIDRIIERAPGPYRAILAVDVLGNLPDVGPLRQAAARHGLALIEDAACALGARQGSIRGGGFGDLAAISFNGNKTVTAGGGGMVLTDDPARAEFIRHISTQARTGSDYRHDMVGFNYRMTNVNAAVGLGQIERLTEMVGMKQAIARRYADSVAGRRDLRFMPVGNFSESGCWLSVLHTATPGANAELLEVMNAAGIAARPFWCRLSDQKPYSDYPSLPSPVAGALTDRTVCLPSSSHLTPEEQDQVIAVLQAWRGPDFPAHRP